MEDVKELYPIVGLQSPDEIIDVNFGQKPFLFDLHSEVKVWVYENFVIWKLQALKP